MATIKDVARLANVSVATVSRTINNEEMVSPETRQAVRRAIEQLGYTPNSLGRDLRCATTNRILVLLPTVSNQFYSKVIRGMEDEADRRGYVLLLCVFHGQKEIETRYLDLLRKRLVDGAVFLSSCQTREEINQFAKKYPVVQCCEYIEHSNTPVVRVDDRQGAVLAVEHLITLGHQRIAMLGSGLSYLSANKRLEGYRQAMRAHGLSKFEQVALADGYSFEAGQKAAKQLLCNDSRPSAIFAVSDSLAAGVISVASQLGLSLPEQLSVMGYDNTSIAKMCQPSISTVAQPRYELGMRAVQLLLEKIADPGSCNKTVLFPAQLLLRQSTSEKM